MHKFMHSIEFQIKRNLQLQLEIERSPQYLINIIIKIKLQDY